MFVIPNKPAHVKEDALIALGFHDRDLKEKLLSGKEMFQVAAWHFSPQHREFDPITGRWKLKTHEGRYIDDDNKCWKDFPPPNYLLDWFLSEYEDEMSLPKNRWMQKSVPSWVKSYCACERQLPRPALQPSVARKRARESEA
jgi:hypothetical protein